MPPLFDPALLFRLRIQPLRTDIQYGTTAWQLPAEAQVPRLGVCLSGQDQFAEMRMAVSETGLFVTAEVRSKRQVPWCRESRAEDSDGVHIWIDTRNSRDVHRATRFCHRFVFAPLGRGPKHERPFASWLPLNRAREDSRPPEEKLLQVSAKLCEGGYDLKAALSWQALTGYDPKDFPIIGFYVAVIDRERGWQSPGLAPPVPVAEDPSLWMELSL